MGVPLEKHRLSVPTPASRLPRPNRVSGADAHTAALRAAQARVDELEGKLADLLVPILEAAGRKAASNFRARAPVGMVAALTAAGPGVSSNSTMVALKPRAAEAEALGLSTAIPTETLHVTLAYLGEIDGPLEPIAARLAAVAANHAPLVGEVAGGGFFGHPEGDGPTILLPDVPGLVELRVDVSEALTAGEIPYSRDHGFQAHVTVAYRGVPEGEFPPEADYRPSDDPAIRCATCLRFDAERGVCVMFDAPAEAEMVCDEWTDEPYDPIGEPLHFDSILVVRGDTEIIEIPLVGVPPLTAASPPPNWVPPAGDEILDVDALVKTLRTKTDPVRRALLEASMTPGLGAAGLDFDVTNPFTAKVISRAGENVRNIAVTTQLNVMRSVKAAYSDGLSIPDTAALIQAGMSAAAPSRATMIARTELAGAVNGGSLAAAQIVSDATGDRYVKRWLTAPGAVYPRHELYEGLDGQEQPLDGLFEVGGSPLMFPGDPDGDPGETINCRCTLVYNSPEGEGEASAEDAPPDFGGDYASSDPIDLPSSVGGAADQLMAGAAKSETLAGGVPDEAKIAGGIANWKKQLRGNLVTDNAKLAKVRVADAYNRESPVLRAQLAEHGPDAAIVIKDTTPPANLLSPGRDTASAKRLTGNRVTILREETLNEARTGPIVPGDGSSLSHGGLEAVLRHEYGHQIEEALTADQKVAFRRALPDPETVRKELTSYAAQGLEVGNAQEAFCELFAIAADPAYDPASWSPWVRKIAHDFFRAPLERVAAPLSRDPRVAEIQTAIREAKGITADDALVMSRSAGRDSDLVGINGYPNREFRDREEALRAVGGKIADEVDRRVTASGVRSQKSWGSVAKRRETAFAKSREAVWAARQDAEAKILERDFPGLRIGQLTDEQYDALYLKVSLDPEVARLSAENQKRLQALVEARRAAETGGKELALARRKATSDLLHELGRTGADAAPTMTNVEADRALWLRLYDLHEDYATQIGSYTLADARKVVADASTLLPREWVEASDRKGSLNVVLRNRGHYWDKHDVLAISTGGDVAGDAPGFSTALHELGHRMEAAIPEIRAWEWAFWSRRTVASNVEANRVAEKLADLFPGGAYEQHEITYKDEFTSPYIGKSYGGNADSMYEILTMGLEGVFNGEHGIWEGDAELRNFVLALLATVG